MTWLDWIEFGSIGIIVIAAFCIAWKISAPTDYREP